MQQDLQLAGLAERSQEAYLRAVRQLADHFRKPPDRITEPELREYLLFLRNERKVSPSALKIAVCGIGFFYRHTIPRDWDTLKNIRVPRPKSLPDVLSTLEVRQLIDAVRTPHNKAYFWTVYSLGLRLQEALNLQLGDIDGGRMTVHVHRGKGAKDRYVPLPARTQGKRGHNSIRCFFLLRYVPIVPNGTQATTGAKNACGTVGSNPE
jgi:integrase